VEFEPGERFVGLGAGDVEGVTFAAQANHLFLKPKATGTRTNLTVLTNRRTYHFDYAASATAPDPGGADVLYVLRFLYPDAATLRPHPAEAAPLRIEAPADQPRNSNYWYCGREELAPLSAWDDGVQTHLRFDPRRELPALFVRNDDGTESLLNFHIANGELIAHRLARRFIVRRGGLVGCIVNRGFAGTTERSSSGTLTPEVERRTREAPDALAR
jgi:type IV secretion system protein VirB9